MKNSYFHLSKDLSKFIKSDEEKGGPSSMRRIFKDCEIRSQIISIIKVLRSLKALKRNF